MRMSPEEIRVIRFLMLSAILCAKFKFHTALSQGDCSVSTEKARDCVRYRSAPDEKVEAVLLCDAARPFEPVLLGRDTVQY